MKQEDKKPKKKRSEDKNIDQGKIVDTPNEITGYGIRVRPRIDQSKVLGRRTIRL